MATLKFRASVSGENIKESNSWSNIIKYATQLAKDHKGQVVVVRSNNNVVSESFIYCSEINDIIPA